LFNFYHRINTTKPKLEIKSESDGNKNSNQGFKQLDVWSNSSLDNASSSSSTTTITISSFNDHLIPYKLISSVDSENSEKHLLIVLPDIFMNLEVMEHCLTSSHENITNLDILLIGQPQLSHSSESAFTSPIIYSNCVVSLLHRLFPEPFTKSIVLMGIGTGSITIQNMLMPVESERWKGLGKISAICLINGLYKEVDEFKHRCRDLLYALQEADTSTLREVIEILHLSKTYRQSYESGIFWEKRNIFQSVDKNVPQLYNVIQLLTGYVDTPNDDYLEISQNLLVYNNIPLISIQSSEDDIISIRNAEIFKQDSLPLNRFRSSELEEALYSGGIHVSRVNSGHEIVQERKSYFDALIVSLFNALDKQCISNKLEYSDISEYGDQNNNQLIKEIQEIQAEQSIIECDENVSIEPFEVVNELEKEETKDLKSENSSSSSHYNNRNIALSIKQMTRRKLNNIRNIKITELKQSRYRNLEQENIAAMKYLHQVVNEFRQAVNIFCHTEVSSHYANVEKWNETVQDISVTSCLMLHDYLKHRQEYIEALKYQCRLIEEQRLMNIRHQTLSDDIQRMIRAEELISLHPVSFNSN
jgi:hypothetical protein